MSNYGMAYMGSKSKLASDIIGILPRGKRFVDLFGGGGSMSHCAVLSGKYESVIYNELDACVAQCFRDAIAGKFSKENFKPRWISRDEFHAKKNVDGYIRTCWSFGNDCNSYLFAKEIEEIKRQAFEYCVNGTSIEGVPDCEYSDWNARRLFLMRWANAQSVEDFQRLQCLQSITRLEALQRLERLLSLEGVNRIEIITGDYRNYQNQTGDVVYCDPPYENTKQYSVAGFNLKEFYDWVYDADFPIWFSSYEISDKRFDCVWETERTSQLSATNNSLKVVEKLYANKKACLAYPIKNYKQSYLFN